jgi:hypothetical protein
VGDDDGARVGENVEHLPPLHRPDWQSDTRTHVLSIEHGGQFSPPQSTSLSPLSFSPFVQVNSVGVDVGASVETVKLKKVICLAISIRMIKFPATKGAVQEIVKCASTTSQLLAR